MKINYIILVFILGIIVSCTDNTDSGKMTNITIPNPNYADPNTFISQFYHSNKVGTITFQYDFNQYSVSDSVYGAWYKYFAVYCTFHKLGDKTQRIPIDSVIVNNRFVNINSYESLNYFAYSYTSDANGGTGALFSTDSPNHLQISKSQVFPALDTNISFDEPLQLITPSINTTISKKNDLNIKWDSLHTLFVQIHLIALNTGTNTISGTTYVAGTSDFTIPASVLAKFPKGGVSLTVAETKVYYLYFANNTEIPLFYQTSQTIDMKLTD